MFSNLDREFLEYTFRRYSTIIVLLGALYSVSRPMANTVTSSNNIPRFLPSQNTIPLYLLSLLFLGVLYTYVQAWGDYRNKREELGEAQSQLDELQVRAEFDRKRKESPVAVLSKRLDVEIKESDDDRVSYEFEVKPVFDDGVITHFKAIIATDREVSWDDLNIQENNIEFVEKDEKPLGEENRFLITYKLGEDARPGSPSEFSYAFNQDVVSVDQDAANLMIEEPTRKCIINITFPEDWEPTGHECYDIIKGEYDNKQKWEEDDKRSYKFEKPDGRWAIRWERETPEEEHIYELQWVAEEQ